MPVVDLFGPNWRSSKGGLHLVVALTSLVIDTFAVVVAISSRRAQNVLALRADVIIWIIGYVKIVTLDKIAYQVSYHDIVSLQ